MEIESSAFAPHAQIPTLYTCEGEDRSPPLAWRDVPGGAQSLALIVDDPDAPDPAAPKRTWVHWVLFDIPPETKGLPEGVARDALPAGTREGRNDWDRTGYGGPCPPIGRHRYFFKLYALDTRLALNGTPTKKEVVAAMEGRVIAEAEVVGTYQKRESAG